MLVKGRMIRLGLGSLLGLIFIAEMQENAIAANTTLKLAQTPVEFSQNEQQEVDSESFKTATDTVLMPFTSPENSPSPLILTQQFTQPETPDNSPLQPTLEQLQRYSQEGKNNRNQAEQVTSVSQLSDVQPTDWAFESLQSLVERFGCIAGYPDGTYRGNRPLSRYEFAAGLNACLERIKELIDAAVANRITQEEFEALQRLQNEFAAELSYIRGSLSGITRQLDSFESQQFSTTTQLNGEVIFAFVAPVDNDLKFQGIEANEDQAVLQNRVRLNLNTSFTGRDVLFTRLQAGNAEQFNRGITGEGSQTFNVFGDTENQLEIERLFYQFPVTDKLYLTLAAKGATWDDFVPTVHPFMDDFDGGNGTLSAFGQRNPIYRLGGGTGIGLNYAFNNDFITGIFGPTSLSVGYLASNTAEATKGSGLFNGDFATLAQVTVTPTDRVQFAFTYNHAYSTPGNFGFDNGLNNGPVFNRSSGEVNLSAFNGFTGTGIANSIFGLTEGLNPAGIAKGVVSNSYGIQFAWSISPKVILSAWGGYTSVQVLDVGEGKIWNYALTLGLPDLFKEGSLGGIVIGREPYLSDLDVKGNLEYGLPTASSWHFEAFYKYQLTDNISITPGLIWITNPNQDTNNSDRVIGTLRTTFRF